MASFIGAAPSPVSNYGRLRKRQEKVSFLLRGRDESCHRNSISSMAIDPSTKMLVTGSRDGTARCWDVSSQSISRQLGLFEKHVHWINDIVLLSDCNRVASCSSDHTVKIWGLPETQVSAEAVHLPTLHSFEQHTDYVQALAYSPMTRQLASAGLDSRIYLWDMERAAALSTLGHSISSSAYSFIQARTDSDTDTRSSASVLDPSSQINSEEAPIELHKEDASYWSLAMNAAGTVLVSGSTAKVVRVWDPRANSLRSFKLKGHTDNVRCVVLNAEGTLCLSGSADNTIKLWDLGQQRCVQSFSVHSDSVWSIAPLAGFRKFLSGGRDSNVYLTDTKNAESVLLCRSSHPVLRVLAVEEERQFWISTLDSNVQKWELPTSNVKGISFSSSPVGSSRIDSRAPHSTIEMEINEPNQHSDQSRLPSLPSPVSVPTLPLKQIAGRLPLRSTSPLATDDLDEEPLLSQPVLSLQGLPAILQHQVLNNKHQILTRDSHGNVAVWDVLKGGVTMEYGLTDFEMKSQELFQMLSVPTWFTVDTKLGCLCVMLTASQCFNAEVYAGDVGLLEPGAEDVKVNLGDRLLHALFATWHTKRKMVLCQQPSSSLVAPSPPPPPLDAHNNSTASEGIAHISFPSDAMLSGKPFLPLPPVSRRTSTGSATGSAHGASSHSKEETEEVSGDSDSSVISIQLPEDVPLLVSDVDSGRVILHKCLGHMDGSEGEESIPSWVVDCVQYGRFTAPDQRLSFVLIPFDENDLPHLAQGNRLTAPRNLRVKKMMTYVAGRVPVLPAVPAPSMEGPDSVPSTPSKKSSKSPMRRLLRRSSQENGAAHDPTTPSNSNSQTVTLGDSKAALIKVEDHLEILCRDQVLPLNMNLGTIKQFIWKESSDVTVHYRRKSGHVHNASTPSSRSKHR
eukprot:GILK01006124.1.p1 GENE.GILK01006124.1~~GILK01006124.1.p1  ORF type:complete len:906 (+),score=129.52 GILK01006124.1:136-2853(+)